MKRWVIGIFGVIGVLGSAWLGVPPLGRRGSGSRRLWAVAIALVLLGGCDKGGSPKKPLPQPRQTPPSLTTCAERQRTEVLAALGEPRTLEELLKKLDGLSEAERHRILLCTEGSQ